MLITKTSPFLLIILKSSFQSTCDCSPGEVSNLIVAFFCSSCLYSLINLTTVPYEPVYPRSLIKLYIPLPLAP